MQRSFRAACSGALMLAATPAAANLEQAILNPPFLQLPTTPPKLVAEIKAPDLVKTPPTIPQSNAFENLVEDFLPGTPPPELTEVIEVRPGFIEIRAGGREFDLYDSLIRIWIFFWWNADVEGALRFLSRLPDRVRTTGPVAWKGGVAEFAGGPALVGAEFDGCFRPGGNGCRIFFEDLTHITRFSAFPAPLGGSPFGRGESALSLAMFVETLGTARPVPEPGAWAIMIAGFGLVGCALRRRRRRAVCA